MASHSPTNGHKHTQADTETKKQRIEIREEGVATAAGLVWELGELVKELEALRLALPGDLDRSGRVRAERGLGTIKDGIRQTAAAAGLRRRTEDEP